MESRIRALVIAVIVALASAPFVSSAHEASGDRKEAAAHHDDDAMKAQHERMVLFKVEMDRIAEAIISSDGKGAAEGAEKLAMSIKGHEKDAPHKNLSRVKEFHGLFVTLDKRTAALKAAILANDMPKAGVAYGKVLETCASCHRKFRD